MANITINSSDKTAFVAKLQRNRFACYVDGTRLGPLDGAPSIEPEVENTEVKVYETDKEILASFLDRNDAKLTLTVSDFTGALELNSLKLGDNIIADAKKHVVVLVPITEATGAKGFLFPQAYLMPDGVKPTLGEDGEPNKVELVFSCKATEDDGVPYSFAEVTVGSGE